MLNKGFSPAKRLVGNKQLFIFLTFFLTSISLFAQQADEKVQMATGLRSSGKIYVVVAVLLTVLIGLFIYLIRLDKKISRLEKEENLLYLA